MHAVLEDALLIVAGCSALAFFLILARVAIYLAAGH